MSAAAHPDLVLPGLLQGQWTTAVISSFTADLTFFESRLLGQLAQIPLRIVLVDDQRLASTLDEASRTGQRHRLANKAYVAAPIRHPRSAHAKLVLLLGPANGLMIVGSGNLGYEGYAAPGELWHVFAYSEEEPEHLDEFAAARSYIDGIVAKELVDPPVAELLHTAWGQSTWVTPAPAGIAATISNLDRPIIDQLREAVTQPVQELIAHAPFHDADCAALRELITSFAPESVRLLLTDATSANPTAIAQVLSTATKASVEQIQVKTEAGAYIHAKWVHLIHADSETLLTGSANLSRAALLRSADNGNIEIGVISSGPRGSFEHLYAHLQSTPIKDVFSFGISYQGGSEGDTKPSTFPIVLWSRIDATTLSLTFDRALDAGTTVDLMDHAGRTIGIDAIDLTADNARIDLPQESAERITEGGMLQVRLDDDDDQISVTWPYHLTHLRSRLDKASQRDHLPRVGDLPEQDAELYELLQELDQTLIIDRASVWRIAKPADPPPPESDDDQPAISLADLNWDRVRRDPRYSGYFLHGRGPGLAPTDIQVVLAAIAGRLGDIGILEPTAGHGDDDDLAREGDATSSDPESAEEAEDELEDELTRRRLPISTRTRQAFDRFVRRYSAALADGAFIDELGPIPAATNAAIFNHLLMRLIEREAISANVAIESLVRTWKFLWGDSNNPGITSRLDNETAAVVAEILEDAGARSKTLSGITASLDYSTDEQALSVREVARQVLVSDEFALEAGHLVEAAGSYSMAPRLLEALGRAASTATDADILDTMVATYGIAKASAEWRTERIRRSGRDYRANVLVLTAPVPNLTHNRARDLLVQVAIAAHFAGHGGAYYRIRFEGNGRRDVAFWDDEVRSGIVNIDDDDQELDRLDRPWPIWSIKLMELRAEFHAQPAATA